jgi:hypothetical protein
LTQLTTGRPGRAPGRTYGLRVRARRPPARPCRSRSSPLNRLRADGRPSSIARI